VVHLHCIAVVDIDVVGVLLQRKVNASLNMAWKTAPQQVALKASMLLLGH
jgi:hypothetical protein